MNSLSDLNNYGQTTLNYTDNRNPAVIFDRPLPTNVTYDAAVGETRQAQLGIDITEIIKPDVLNVYYEIDVSSVTGASVVWPTIPSGMTVQNPAVGVYRISFVNTKEIWDIVKQPNILIPNNRSTNFTYTSNISYEPNQTKGWSVFIRITIKAYLASQFSIRGVLSGLQNSRAYMSAAGSISLAISRFRKTSSQVTGSFTSTIAGVARRGARASLTPLFAFTSAARTTRNLFSNLTTSGVIGVYSMVRKALSATMPTSQFTQITHYFRNWGIGYSGLDVGFWDGWQDGYYGSSLESKPWVTANMGYNGYKRASRAVVINPNYNNGYSSVGIGWGRVEVYANNSGTWSLEQTFTESAFTNDLTVTLTNATKTNPVRVTVREQLGSLSFIKFKFNTVSGMTQLNGNAYYAKIVNAYQYDLYTDAAMTVGLNGTSFGTYTAGSSSSINYIDGDQQTGFGYGNLVSLDSTASNMVVVTSGGVNGIVNVYWYSRIGTSWNLVNSITSGGYTLFYQTFDAEMSGDGNYTVLLSKYQPSKLYIYNKSSTWSLQQTITLNSSTVGSSVTIDSTGNYIAVTDSASTLDSNTPSVAIYKRTGSTWALVQTITDYSFNDVSLNPNVYSTSNTRVEFNSDASLLLVRGILNNSGKVILRLYQRTGSTWNFVQYFNPDLDGYDNYYSVDWAKYGGFGSTKDGNTIQVTTAASTIYKIKTYTGI